MNAFKKLRGPNPINSSYNPSLYLDGANGVGGKKMNVIKKKLDGFLDVTIFNAGGNGGKLNLNVRSTKYRLHYTDANRTIFYSAVPIS